MLIDKNNGILGKAKNGLRRIGRSIPIVRNRIKAPENNPEPAPNTALQQNTTTETPNKPKTIGGFTKRSAT